MYRYIQRTIDWGVKFASLAITGPATWVVATRLFNDITDPYLLFVMRFAAVFLIEGVLLSNWLLLEFDKGASPEIKARYGLTAMTMYIALAIIGWQHEGPTGLVFRIALLAALIGSGWDTYVYTWQRMTANIDRSVENSGKVKRHARNLSIKEAIMRREAEHTVTVSMIHADRQASLEHTQLYGQRLIAHIQLDDKAERLSLMDRETALSDGSNGSNAATNGKKKQIPALPPMAATGLKKSFSTDDRNFAGQPLRLNILGALAEDPSYTEANLAEKFGVPTGEIETHISALVDDGKLEMQERQDGRTYIVTQEAEFRNNGKRVRMRPRAGSLK